jgi:PAS domain S-box-containing protein
VGIADDWGDRSKERVVPGTPAVREPTARLRRWYKAYSIVGAILLMGVGTWIAAWQVNALRVDALGHSREELQRRAETLSILLQHHTGHLERLRDTTEVLLGGGVTPSPPPWELLEDGPDGPYVMLSAAQDQARRGTFFRLGTKDALRTDPDGQRRVGLYMYLLGILRIEYGVHPALVTTWFRRFGEAVVIYPGISPADFRAAYHDVEVEEQLTLDPLGMPFWARLRADENPAGVPFWTHPYVDILGKGIAVTYAAPVRVGGQVVGMVGTDVLLNKLGGLMLPPSGTGGRFLLVSDTAGLILEPNRQPAPSAGNPPLATILPPAERDARHEFRVSVAGTPWDLVWTIGRWEMLLAVLPSSIVPFLLLALMSLLVLVGHVAVRRRFVQPAIALVRHLEAVALGERPPALDVPQDWRRWFDSVTDSFKLRDIATNLDVVVGRVHWTGAGAATEIVGGEGLRELLGLPEDAALDTASLLAQLHPEDVEVAKGGLQAALRGGQTVRRDLRVRRTDGTYRWLRTFANPRDDDPTLLDCMVMDVTAEVEAEELRRRFETRMQRAQKAESLGILAGGVAHDFNNILMGMIGSAELADMDLPEDSPLREHLHEVIKGGRRASELAHQMLAYAGRGQLSLEQVSLAALISDLRGLMEASIPKRVDLHLDLGMDLPFVEGDPTQLRQVLMNLVINAAEAIGDEAGTIRVTTASREWQRQELRTADLSDDLAPGVYVSIRVQDTGCGMDAKTRRRVFEPFFSTKFLGRGLGLASVLGIVRGHGGAIGLTSEPERGTTFQVLLPVLDEDAGWISHTPPPMEVRPRRDRGLALLVDDEPAIRKVVGMMLRRLGFEVLAAEDGLEALDILSTVADKAVLVLLDYSMPRMGGPETLAGIRAAWPGLPVIICSGYDSRDLTTSEMPGATAYLQKPIRFGDLAEILDAVLDGGPAPTRGEQT